MRYRFDALEGGDWIAIARFAHHEVRRNQVKRRLPTFPPFPRNFLACRENDVAAGPCGEIAHNRCFYIHSRFHNRSPETKAAQKNCISWAADLAELEWLSTSPPRRPPLQPVPCLP